MDPPSLIINRIRKHMMKNGDMLEIDEIVQILSIDLIGIVLDDDEVIKASNHGEPVAFQPNTKGFYSIPKYCKKNSRRICTITITRRRNRYVQES